MNYKDGFTFTFKPVLNSQSRIIKKWPHTTGGCLNKFTLHLFVITRELETVTF